jgi:hypothetical protein
VLPAVDGIAATAATIALVAHLAGLPLASSLAEPGKSTGHRRH